MVDAIKSAWENADCPETVIVHGACPKGADNIADMIAAYAGFELERYPAEWKTFGRAAGHIRNQKMVDLGADVCLAFIKDESPGATGCSNAAIAAGIPTYIWRE